MVVSRGLAQATGGACVRALLSVFVAREYARKSHDHYNPPPLLYHPSQIIKYKTFARRGGAGRQSFWGVRRLLTECPVGSSRDRAARFLRARKYFLVGSRCRRRPNPAPEPNPNPKPSTPTPTRPQNRPETAEKRGEVPLQFGRKDL